MIPMSYDLIVGKNPVIEAIQSGRTIKEILISQQLNHKTEQKLQRAANRMHINMRKVPRQTLDELTNDRHQGIIAYVKPYEYASRSEERRVGKECSTRWGA